MVRKKQAGTTMGLRLSDELKEALSVVAASNSRTLHGQVVRVLEDSLTTRPAGDDRLSTPWAREMGYLLGLLARDCEQSAQSADEAFAAMKVAAPVLLDRLLDAFRDKFGAEEIASVEDEARPLAEALASDLAGKLLRAHQPRRRTGDVLADRMADDADRYAIQGQPSLGRPVEEMQKLQAALSLPTQAGESEKTAGKPRKRRKK